MPFKLQALTVDGLKCQQITKNEENRYNNMKKEIWRVSIQISLLYPYRLYTLAIMYTYDAATGI